MEGLRYAGVSVAALANNHSGNYGRAGLDKTVRVLQGAGIAPAGMGMSVVKDVRGLKFGFMAFNVLFLREHNRIAGELARANASWKDERIFRTAQMVLIVILVIVKPF